MDTPQSTSQQPDDKPAKQPRVRKPKSPAQRKGSYIINIVLNIAFLYVANHLVAWKAQFIIADKWTSVLGIVTTSIVINLIINAIFLVMDPKPVYYLGKLVADGYGIYVGIRMHQVFPFDFNGFFQSGWLNSVFPWLIIVGIVGICIAILVRTVRFISGKEIYD